MYRGVAILVLCFLISTAKAQLNIGDEIVGGITEGLVEGTIEALVGDVPVAGDVVTGVVEELPISDVVAAAQPLEVLGLVNDITNNPTDIITDSEFVENVPVVESVGPVLEVLGGVSENVVETVTESDVVENLPVDDATDVVGDVVKPVGKITARTLLRLILMRRLGLKS